MNRLRANFKHTRDDLNFSIVNFPLLSINGSLSFVSYHDILDKSLLLIMKLPKDSKISRVGWIIIKDLLHIWWGISFNHYKHNLVLFSSKGTYRAKLILGFKKPTGATLESVYPFLSIFCPTFLLMRFVLLSPYVTF